MKVHPGDHSLTLVFVCAFSLSSFHLFFPTRKPQILFYIFHQGSEVVDQILHTVSKSNSLEELTLENAGLKA